MNKNYRNAILAGLLAPAIANASVSMEGEVTLDYYIADVDADGYEYAEMDFYVAHVVNDAATRAGPLSLAGWLTRDPQPDGAGTEAAYLPIGTLAGHSSVEVWDIAEADDMPPGEYYVHTLLQDDRFPGSFEDARSLTPRLLWRGGLEGTGLHVYSYGRDLGVDIDQLRNNRLDARYTHEIELTLYATYGFGPASDGYELCRAVVPGLYAGEVRHGEGFDCHPDAVPDGEYTLHLRVAELGGRGGESTLTGPDAHFIGGRLDHFPHDHYVYYSGATGAWLLLPLIVLGAWRALRPIGSAGMRRRPGRQAPVAQGYRPGTGLGRQAYGFASQVGVTLTPTPAFVSDVHSTQCAVDGERRANVSGRGPRPPAVFPGARSRPA